MERASDAEILTTAKAESECVLTHDLDYGQLLAFSGESAPSVVIFRLRRADSETMFRRLTDESAGIKEALKTGAIVTVEESVNRIRPLPIVRS